jgi:ABC-2 type transport system permease protein
MGGVGVIARKELADFVSNRAYQLTLVLLLVSMVIAGVSAHGMYGGSDLLVIRNEAIVVNSLGVLVAIAYGFNTINKERHEGNLKILLSYPIFRDQIIIGKLLAGLMTISVITILSLSVGLVCFILLAKIIPTIDIIVRFSTFATLTILLLTGWVGLSVLLSTLFKDAKTTLLVLLLFVFLSNSEVLSYFGSVIPRLLYGPYNFGSQANTQALSLTQFITKMSPSAGYTYISASLSVITIWKWVGTERVFIPTVITDVLIYYRYSVTLLVIIPILTFAASYVAFTRRDVT